MKLYRREASGADYHEAKRRVTSKVVMRLSRGNTNTQNGNSCSEAKLRAKSRDADEWMLKTRKAVEATQ